MAKILAALALASALCLLCTACGGNSATSADASALFPSSPDSSTWPKDGTSASMVDAAESTASGEYPLLTPQIYGDRRNGPELACVTATIQTAELLPDSYGTLYYHLTVFSLDEYAQEYKLLANYTNSGQVFETGETYCFCVRPAAARGVLIESAEATEP